MKHMHKRRIGKGIIVIILLGLFATSAIASGTKLTAQSTMKFLSLSVGAKSAGMADCYYSNTPDASVHFLNPAALINLKRTSVFLDRNIWVADITQISGALTQPIGSRAVLGIGLIIMDYGDIPGTEINMVSGGSDDGSREYISTGQVDVNQFAVSCALGVAISNQFSVGGQIKLAHSGLGSSNVILGSDSLVLRNDLDVLAFDVGTQFLTDFKGISFYMSLSNFSGEQAFPRIVQTYNIPLNFSIGATVDIMRLVPGIAEKHSMLFSVKGSHPIDYIEKFNLGMEYSFAKKMFLRGGYKFNYGIEDWSMGMGIRKQLGSRALSFDYAFVNTKYFSGANRMSLAWEF